VVQGGQVNLVDQHTGRIFTSRSWSEGLRQAVEAREGLTITAETQSIARISRQRFFQMYEGICGLTGTAQGSEREFWDIYGVSVVTIPLRRPCQRITRPTRFFADKASKWSAVVDEIRLVHATGRPVLVGTKTIEDSLTLARQLDEHGIPHQLLNGKQDADEAHIVAHAGGRHAVTIATNMAGRGTDIRLAPGVEARGGLHVIGTEPHDSPRVDRQLAGRSARQGDRGSFQMFASAEDHLIARGSPRLGRRMRRLAGPTGQIATDLTGDLGALQRRVERRLVAARRQLCRRDLWLEEVVVKMTKDD
jgi:preprotein translocase subunit SecA